MGSSSKSHITVRSLGSGWKVRPWSIDQIEPAVSRKQWLAFLSALLDRQSKSAMRSSSSGASSRMVK